MEEGKKIHGMLFLSKGKENENDIMERGEKCVLQSAIEANADRKTIETVIRSGADINLKDSFGNTPMFGLTSVGMYFVFRSKHYIVLYLLRNMTLALSMFWFPAQQNEMIGPCIYYHAISFPIYNYQRGIMLRDKIMF